MQRPGPAGRSPDCQEADPVSPTVLTKAHPLPKLVVRGCRLFPPSPHPLTSTLLWTAGLEIYRREGAAAVRRRGGGGAG